MSIRYLIAAALMASACAAHADVIPATGAGIVNGSNVAGAIGDSSVIAGVNRAAGSDALVEALYQKVSASVGNDMKVSLKQGIDGVYVTGLSTAKAAALAGDGMSVISTADGFKIVASAPAASGTGNANAGGGAATGTAGTNTGSPATGSPLGASLTPMPGADFTLGNGNGNGNANANANGAGNGNGNANGADNGNGNANGAGNGNANGAGNSNANGNGNGNGNGNATEVPEPSSIALVLAGMLGVAGVGRRRAR
jgi:hypothetical protein